MAERRGFKAITKDRDAAHPVAKSWLGTRDEGKAIQRNQFE
jgi:hypothetical protein